MRNKALSAAVAVGLMLGTTTVGFAQSAQDRAPGQQMQDKGSVRGWRASCRPSSDRARTNRD